MLRHFRRSRGFTIVELLVVIGVMALLMGILLPALSGARNRSRKTVEISNLRQVGLAWTMYANNNNDSILPGYLSPDVQTHWKTRYRYPDHVPIPGDDAATWVWRLFGFLDANHEVIHGYLEEDNPGIQATIDESFEFSRTPAFAYNAYYMGGWWTMEDVGTLPEPIPAPRFYDARRDGVAVSVVSRSIGSIRRSSEVVVFTTTASPELREPGREYKDIDDTDPGWHYAVPPTLADEAVWRMSAGTDVSDQYTVEVLSATNPDDEGNYYPTPCGRYTGHTASLMADGHVEPLSAGELSDIQRWIDTASGPDFTHDP